MKAAHEGVVPSKLVVSPGCFSFRFHIVALVWFGGILILGLAWRLCRNIRSYAPRAPLQSAPSK